MSDRPTALRVRFVSSGAAELIVGIASMADPSWRGTFASGEGELARARSALGADFTRRVAAVGRFGYLNLLAVVAQSSGPLSMSGLITWLRRTPADTVHLAALGGRRRQLRELVEERTLLAAVHGESGARREVRAAVESGQTVLEVSRWMLAAPSSEVHETLLDTLRRWRAERYPRMVERQLTQELDQLVARARSTYGGKPAGDIIRSVADGLTYEPESAPRLVLLMPTPAVRPVVAVVDGVAAHAIAYSPPAVAAPRDALLAMSRAIGDETRLAILEVLMAGETTATELCAALGAPRTTLLHHLALLRAAGLLTTSVVRGGSTTYALRLGAAEELVLAARQVLG